MHAVAPRVPQHVPALQPPLQSLPAYCNPSALSCASAAAAAASLARLRVDCARGRRQEVAELKLSQVPWRQEQRSCAANTHSTRGAHLHATADLAQPGRGGQGHRGGCAAGRRLLGPAAKLVLRRGPLLPVAQFPQLLHERGMGQAAGRSVNPRDLTSRHAVVKPGTVSSTHRRATQLTRAEAPEPMVPVASEPAAVPSLACPPAWASSRGLLVPA
jgi:hypothetical protein